MKIGVGTDIIACNRFERFTTAELEQLLSTQELEYCLAEKIFTMQRLAVRYAAKEAAYKALFSLVPDLNIPFKQFLPHVEISKNTVTGAPTLCINWQKLGIDQKIETAVTLSHTPEYATATVIFYQNNS